MPCHETGLCSLEKLYVPFHETSLCSLEKELTLYMCLFMKHNSMVINRSLCSLEKLTPWEKHKKSCGYSPKLLSVEPNILIIS